jgi:N-acetylglucosamine kinase-like BadF-type ATPase
VVLCADNVTAHAGLLRGARGVALTVGTGVNCLAVDPAAAVHRRVDGWGHLFGDDGSGFAIGRAGLAAVLRAVDGRGPETALTAPAQARFGTAHRMTQGLYTSPTVVDTTAQFAVAVLDAADDGDAVATAIVRAAAAELARTTTTAVATLPGDDPVDVATTGRLLDRDVLRLRWCAALARDCPRAVVVANQGSPLDGACFLAAAPDHGADDRAYRPLLHVYRDGELR